MFHTLERCAAGILVFALSLALPGPASAAGRQGHVEERAPQRSVSPAPRAGGFWLELLRQLGRSVPGGTLIATWLGDGPVVDPDGKPLPPAPAPLTSSPTRPSGIESPRPLE